MIRYDSQASNSSGSSPDYQGEEAYLQSTASSVGEALSTSAEKLKEQAMQKRDDVTQAVKSRAASYFDQQKHQVAGILHDVSATTRHCVQEMQQQQHPRIGQAVEVIADQMDNLSQSLERRDMNYFVDQAQDLARRRPGLFVGGALALGFLAIRFLKSARPAGESRSSEFEPQGASPRPNEAPEPYQAPRSSPETQGIHNETPAPSGSQFTI